MEEPAQEVKEAFSPREEKANEDEEEDYEEINSNLFGNDPSVLPEPKREEVVESVNSPRGNSPRDLESEERP